MSYSPFPNPVLSGPKGLSKRLSSAHTLSVVSDEPPRQILTRPYFDARVYLNLALAANGAFLSLQGMEAQRSGPSFCHRLSYPQVASNAMKSITQFESLALPGVVKAGAQVTTSERIKPAGSPPFTPVHLDLSWISLRKKPTPMTAVLPFTLQKMLTMNPAKTILWAVGVHGAPVRSPLLLLVFHIILSQSR